MAEFRMPSLGADMDEGTLVEWLVKPGDVVHRGDVVAVVDTAKTAIEVEVFEDGVVERLLVEPGTRLPVGAPLAVITSGAAAPAPPPAARAPQAVRSPLVRHLAEVGGVDVSTLHGSGPGGVVTRHDVEAATAAPRRSGRAGVRASPLARARAAALGVDLSTVSGTGPGGAVTARDLEAAGPPPEVRRPEPAAAEQPVARATAADKAAAMRLAIGELMARSKREVPHYYLTATIDMSRAVAWLRDENARRPVERRLVPAVLLLKAAAVATHTVPEVNGFWLDGRFRPGDGVHLGVAVALRPSGLVAPAIRDADTLDLDTLMARLRDLVGRARAGSLRQSEMASPTITVTNLGDQGVDAVYGVIYPPQVALVGFGRLHEQPWAQDGLLGVRPVVVATLSGDHRASDGHRGGRYLSAVAELLQKPEEL